MGVALRDRGWAGTLLQWRWEGATLLTAEIAAARYFVRGDPHEILAWCELRDVGGARRVEVGSFPSVGEARAACVRHAATLCVRERKAAVANATPGRALILAEMEPGRKHRGATKEERINRGDNVTSTRGNAATYTLKRLKRDRPAEAVEQDDNVNLKRGTSRRPWGTSDACLQRRARLAHVLGDE